MVALHHWPAPALVVDTCGRIVAANVPMAHCLGTAAAKLVGTELSSWALDQAEISDFLRKGMALPVEFRFHASDGSVRRLALSVARRVLAAGDLVAAVDMTLYRAAERKLREERERYLDMIRAASDWFYETEHTHQTESEVEARLHVIRSGADGALKQYELHTKWPDGVVDRSYDPEGLAAHMKRTAAYEPFRDMIHRQIAPDGTERYYRASGMPYLRDGFHVGYRGVSANVTAQVLAERALRRERHHLEEAQRLAGVGSAVRDVATGAESWSPQLCRLLGVDAAAAAPCVTSRPPPRHRRPGGGRAAAAAARETTLSHFVEDADRAWLDGAIAAAKTGGSPAAGRLRIRRPDGAARVLEVAIALLEGAPATLLMVLKDVTERHSPG
jgi:PAS domain-containing protein